uniref:Cytochrome b n=2 Tax=Argopecten irradians TaxID=31199 RepID=C6YB51_ARGIR|nr:cytochrome b [Argopecten irradians irradians]ABH07599.1 cytochrome b [Argopecten irradians irradians]ALA07914.1 cytochrome b [Argopecten irradians irradians]AOR53761.1 cytochrome b [Argopecten irradians]
MTKNISIGSGAIYPVVKGTFYDLPCPANLSVWWGLGSLLGVCVAGQVLTGWFLSFYYTAHEDLAYSSVIFIMKEVNFGWLMRSFHINVANFMFVCLYFHVGRGIYYGSFRMYKVWATGVVLLLLVMLTAFTGYVLPWSQMAYWAAQVISSMVTAVPVFGGDIAMWVWGGYAVGNITLKRLFSIHFLLPFVILGVFFLHLIFLHVTGSGNPLGLDSECNLVRFHSFFTVKDLVGVSGGLLIVVFMISFYPYSLLDGGSFIACDYMETPASIHPEWYFLFAYAILRSVPNKIGGIVLLLLSILVLFVLPEIWCGKMEGFCFYPGCQFLFWTWIFNFIILTYVGSQGVDQPFVMAGEWGTIYYFLFFPLVGIMQHLEDTFSKKSQYAS